MSVHSSLTSKAKGKRSRSVLKRFERLKELQEKEKWQPEDSVFGLPKVKILRWKTKKTKKAAEAEAPAAGEAVAGTTAEAPAAKAATKKEEKPGKKKD